MNDKHLSEARRIARTLHDADPAIYGTNTVTLARAVVEMDTRATESAEALDHTARLLDTLTNLVDLGAPGAAQTMARELRTGEVAAAVKLQAARGGVVATGWAINFLCETVADHLDRMGAENHCQWHMVMPARSGKPDRVLHLVAQWKDGETPLDMVRALKGEVATLHGLARAVATAQLAHDRDPSESARAALDVALTALFAYVPAEVTL